MKNIKFIVFALLTFSAVSFKPAEELKWYGFNEGYELSKKTGKIMLVDVYTDWCGWCKRMDRDTYAKSEIIQAINKNYIPIKFNPEIEGVSYNFEGNTYTGMQLLSVIGNNQINGYPATVFLYPKEKKMNLVSGYYDATRFQTVLSSVVESFAPVVTEKKSESETKSQTSKKK
jgi:uncharacterized protein YyaL (SSP411 family)